MLFRSADLADRFDWVCDYPNGLHARPAAQWIDAARRQRARIQVRSGDVVADPRNLVSLLQLGLRSGDAVVVSAEGEGAAEALAAMRATILSLTAQEVADAAKAAAKAVVGQGWTPPTALVSIPGISASPGLAVGRIHGLRAAEIVVPDVPVDLVEGGAELDRALGVTRQIGRAHV